MGLTVVAKQHKVSRATVGTLVNKSKLDARFAGENCDKSGSSKLQNASS
jgi:hypothetical protein